MDLEMVFLICNNFALLLWVLLIFLPRSKMTDRLIYKGWAIAALGVVYALIFLLPKEPIQGNFFSLEGIAALFENQSALLAGWVHYLAFDLFVGAALQKNFEKLASPQWIRVPTLILTFMLGPIGYLVFHIYRESKNRTA